MGRFVGSPRRAENSDNQPLRTHSWVFFWAPLWSTRGPTRGYTHGPTHGVKFRGLRGLCLSELLKRNHGRLTPLRLLGLKKLTVLASA